MDNKVDIIIDRPDCQKGAKADALNSRQKTYYYGHKNT